MLALRSCACALALLSALALCAAQLDKRAAEYPPAPFVLGTRYGRSAPRHIAPRNDRFFMGSRYGKRSLPAVRGEGDGDAEGAAHRLAARNDRFFMSRYGRQQPGAGGGGGGGAALLCEMPGVFPLLRCRLDRKLAFAPAPEPSAAED